MMKPLLLACVCLTLAACAAAPMNIEGVNGELTPNQVNQATPHQNSKVVWGGMIISTRPMQNATRIEVLAYPLSGQEPDRHATALGRFMLDKSGYLEPAEFATGRWISVVGIVKGIQPGKVGEASYDFPLLEAQQIHLWPEASSPSDIRTRFHFGIGIQL